MRKIQYNTGNWKGERKMKPQLKALMQIGIIVRDLEKAVKCYQEMGIEPWDISVMNNTVPPFDDLKFDGKQLETKGDIIKTAMLQGYGLEIELIEPIAEETAYYRWLEEHGPGIHHIAFDVNDEYETFLEKGRQLTGKEAWIHGEGIHGMMDFSYVDLREQMGIIVECYKNIQSGKPYLIFDTKPEVVK